MTTSLVVQHDALQGHSARPLTTAGQFTGLFVFAASCYFPYLVGRVTSPAYVEFLALWLYTLCALLARRSSPAYLAAWVSFPILVACATYWMNVAPDVTKNQLGELPGIVNQYVLVPPVAIIAGVVAVSDPRIAQFSTCLRFLSALNALLAVFERVRGAQLFPANTVLTNFSTSNRILTSALTDDGSLRGIVASSHPLVLATLFAATIPLVFRGRLRWWNLVELAVVIAGIWATDSIGPLGVGLAAVAIGLAGRTAAGQRLRQRLAASMGAVFAVYLVGIAGFFAAAIWWWRPIVNTLASTSESTQYRFALYSLVPRLFASRPLGFGLGDVPAGSVLIERTGPTLDVSVSVDSELVLSVIQLGVLGALIYFTVLWLSIRGYLLGRGGALGLGPSLVMNVIGLVLALHVWPTVAGYWEFMIGIGIASLLAPRPSEIAPDVQRVRQDLAQRH